MWRDKDPDGRAWLDAGFTAREAELWRKWRIPLKAAQEWRACGVDEALRWAVHQIPATDARMWRDLKVKPVEAGRLARKGRSPMDIVSEWWRAGIPFDEVADWLGAGLTAAEAASQRARGITVEQAA